VKTRRIVMVLCVLLFLLAGCNSIEDVKHLTEKQMLKYVQDRIGEEVELISVNGDIGGNDPVTYQFVIVDRDIEFEVSAHKFVSGIDLMRLGNYKLLIYLRYIEDVKAHYQAESAKLAEKYQVGYELHIAENGKVTSFAETTVGSYNDIDSLTDFFIELDKLYAFELKPKDKASNIGFSGIYFSSSEDLFYGPDFSRSHKARLERDELKEALTKKYVLSLKADDKRDPAIPQKVWDKYNLEPEK